LHSLQPETQQLVHRLTALSAEEKNRVRLPVRLANQKGGEVRDPLLDPPSVRWQWVAFWVMLFTFWYCWPTEAQQPTVTIQVAPRFILPLPYTKTTFHIKWRIARHKDNRHFIFSYGCDSGETSFSSQSMEGENDKATWDIWREINAGTGCAFEVCVYRQKDMPYACAKQNVEAPEEPR